MIRIPKTIIRAKQRVCLGGLDLPQFATYISAIQAIWQVFASNLPERALQMWQPQWSHGFIGLDASSRYFVSASGAETAAQSPLGASIDPLGLLQRAASTRHLVHTDKNIVKFYEWSHEKPG